jgi:hypothetical protein
MVLVTKVSGGKGNDRRPRAGLSGSTERYFDPVGK